MRINKKERRAAIRHLLVEKILANRVHILAFEPFVEPKTKRMADFINNCQLNNNRVLFLGEGFNVEGTSAAEKFEMFVRSLRNIPKLGFRHLPQVSGYDVIVSHDLVIMDSAIDHLFMLLGRKE